MSAAAIVSRFSLLDAAIAAASLAVTLWIGVRVKRYIGTIEDYLVASRGMGLYVGAASLISTGASSRRRTIHRSCCIAGRTPDRCFPGARVFRPADWKG